MLPDRSNQTSERRSLSRRLSAALESPDELPREARRVMESAFWHARKDERLAVVLPFRPDPFR